MISTMKCRLLGMRKVPQIYLAEPAIPIQCGTPSRLLGVTMCPLGVKKLFRKMLLIYFVPTITAPPLSSRNERPQTRETLCHTQQCHMIFLPILKQMVDSVFFRPLI